MLLFTELVGLSDAGIVNRELPTLRHVSYALSCGLILALLKVGWYSSAGHAGVKSQGGYRRQVSVFKTGRIDESR